MKVFWLRPSGKLWSESGGLGCTVAIDVTGHLSTVGIDEYRNWCRVLRSGDNFSTSDTFSCQLNEARPYHPDTTAEQRFSDP